MQTQKPVLLGASRASPSSTSRQRLSTESVPPSDRLAYWSDMVCAVYTALECDRPADAALRGEIEFSDLAVLAFTQVRSNAPAVRRTPRLVAAKSDESFLIQLQRRGVGIVEQDGRQAILRPGDFALYDTSRPYELRFPDQEHEVVVVRIDRRELDRQVVNLPDLTATTVPGSTAAGNLLISMIDTLDREVDRLHPSSVLGIAEGITSVVAAGLRTLPGANVQMASTLCAYHIARVKAYLREHLRDPLLSVTTIAQAMKLSPDHLSRLFRGQPVPLSRLIWKERLDACRRDLSDPRLTSRSVTDIAFSWGFSDAAHFSRSFKEQFGMSPREWRQTQAASSRH